MIERENTSFPSCDALRVVMQLGDECDCQLLPLSTGSTAV